jgi:hypothetical protein
MQRIISGSAVRRAAGRAAAALGLSATACTISLLTACSTPHDSTFTVFADPGKYQYYSCEQLAAQTKNWTTREQELRALMEKANQGAAGPVVNLLAYKADYVAATEELRLIEIAMRSKNCNAPPNWGSSSAIQ